MRIIPARLQSNLEVGHAKERNGPRLHDVDLVIRVLSDVNRGLKRKADGHLDVCPR